MQFVLKNAHEMNNVPMKECICMHAQPMKYLWSHIHEKHLVNLCMKQVFDRCDFTGLYMIYTTLVWAFKDAAPDVTHIFFSNLILPRQEMWLACVFDAQPVQVYDTLWLILLSDTECAIVGLGLHSRLGSA